MTTTPALTESDRHDLHEVIDLCVNQALDGLRTAVAEGDAALVAKFAGDLVIAGEGIDAIAAGRPL